MTPVTEQEVARALTDVNTPGGITQAGPLARARALVSCALVGSTAARLGRLA